MNKTEVELKYHIECKKAEAILYEVTRYLSISNMEEEKLKAVYYDTLDNTLLQNRIAFRIRKEGEKTSATVKAQGTYKNGIFSRKEWNLDVSDKKEADAKDLLLRMQLDIDLEEIVKDKLLIPKVTTEFVRKRKEIEIKGCLVELSFDKGEIITERGRDRFCEMELELLKGNQSYLEAFGKDLSLKFNLKPQPVSKYARGLRLLGLV